LSGVWLILPTYDEAENIEALVEAALAQLSSTGLAHTVLVVDDSSPDGTGAIADRLAARLADVSVLHRPRKEGLGRAYQMDSDFSHDPADIPRLVAAAGAADVVLGSRYVPGGGVTNWALSRRILSRGGCAYARLILGVPVRDLTGGFKCWNRSALERLDLEGVDTHGYGFQIEMTYRAIRAGLTVAEVPILFRERREGQSKMDTWITFEAVWKVPTLRLRGRRSA
jgi:dolichol-phosphate mannosyltransferase